MDSEIYKQNILDHAQHPRNKAEMLDPDVAVPAKNASCGDSFILYFRVEDGLISEATFSGVGCAISQAAASLLTEKLTGMTLDDAKKLTEEDVRSMLGVPISVAREKCAFLALRGIEEAIKKYE
jgi:nitrogen fixation NifU-like protein